MTAKEMFNKLGYRVHPSKFDYRLQYKKVKIIIRFDNDDKSICKYYDDTNGARDINIDELKAINKQVEELGW